MKKVSYILLVFLLVFPPSKVCGQDSLKFKGQLSLWTNYNPSSNPDLWFGGNYIPQLNYSIGSEKKGLIDFEASVYMSASAGIFPVDSIKSDALLKPYRGWIRYSTSNLEIRLGLQKISFGSASLLRPLMWFDRIDARDPLKLTDGVWGLLGRYYFQNNVNIWLWGLYGNKGTKGWELSPTNSKFPELGGRIQIPVPAGEAALSYNYRVADTRNLSGIIPSYEEVGENKIGFDIKLDLVVGLWLEASLVNKSKEMGIYTNQELVNAGIDYTFGIGNGLYLIFEQLLTASDEKAFNFSNPSSFSLLSVSYPVGLFDNLSGIIYYDWKNNNTYNFINWQRQFNNISLYLMGFWNPVRYNIPSQGEGQNLFAGRGFQVMLVWNH